MFQPPASGYFHYLNKGDILYDGNTYSYAAAIPCVHWVTGSYRRTKSFVKIIWSEQRASWIDFHCLCVFFFPLKFTDPYWVPFVQILFFRLFLITFNSIRPHYLPSSSQISFQSIVSRFNFNFRSYELSLSFHFSVRATWYVTWFP